MSAAPNTTPGPWKVRALPNRLEIWDELKPHDQHARGHYRGRPIAVIPYGRNGARRGSRVTFYIHTDDPGNAALLAAAPELFEALRAWLALADQAIALGVTPHPDEVVILNRARAAVSKIAKM